MKLTTTEAIVLKTLKYSENSLIAHCFTQGYGMTSYMIKGILKPTKKGLKPSFFQPLTQLEIVSTHSRSSSFQYIKEARFCQIYKSLHTHIVKNAQVYFLADVCKTVLMNEPANPILFEFLQKEFTLLDQLEHSANFHIKFLIDLSQFLGFYPLNTPDNSDCFLLNEGRFGKYKIEEKHVILGESFHFFKQFLLSKQNCLHLKMSQKQRNELLQNILLYYQWHCPGFTSPQSLKILQSLFV